MMEKLEHSIVTERMREFKQLRRQYRATIREERVLDVALFNHMLELDEWLADNCPEWHQNYADLERKEL